LAGFIKIIGLRIKDFHLVLCFWRSERSGYKNVGILSKKPEKDYLQQ
jgi:hypothetical protein